jgi:hypothetical protein
VVIVVVGEADVAGVCKSDGSLCAARARCRAPLSLAPFLWPCLLVQVSSSPDQASQLGTTTKTSEFLSNFLHVQIINTMPPKRKSDNASDDGPSGRDRKKQKMNAARVIAVQSARTVPSNSVEVSSTGISSVSTNSKSIYRRLLLCAFAWLTYSQRYKWSTYHDRR